MTGLRPFVRGAFGLPAIGNGMTELAGAGQLRRASRLLRGTAPVPDRVLLDAVRSVRVALTDAAGWPDRMAGPAEALARTAWRDAVLA